MKSRQGQRRNLGIERLESRRLLHFDANVDGDITAADALLIINHLDRNGNTPGLYSNLDVNGDAKITARDALNVINELGRPQPRHEIRFRLGKLDTYGLTRDEVMWAINEAFADYEEVADVDMRIVTSGQHATISSREIYLGGGQHARGQASGNPGNQIWFHNGWLSNLNTWWGRPTLWASPVGLKKILRHEIGHAIMGWRHTRNDACVMSIQASSVDFCVAETNWLTSKYGRAND